MCWIRPNEYSHHLIAQRGQSMDQLFDYSSDSILIDKAIADGIGMCAVTLEARL